MGSKPAIDADCTTVALLGSDQAPKSSDLHCQGSKPLTTHTYATLMRRLAHAGFTKRFVRPAILPEWWDENYAGSPDLLPEIEVRVARFLGLPLAAVKDPNATLAAPEYLRAQLRRVRDLNRERLGPAIHTALQVGAAVVRSLRGPATSPTVPPADGLVWREQMQAGRSVTLDALLDDLWLRGIPVVPLEVLPAPSFQGVACVVEGRPVILLGHKHDEPGRVAFFVAHEAAHIAVGDCVNNQPVIDEEDEIVDEADMERRADRYATHVLVGGDSIPPLDGEDYRELASHAARLEGETGADASVTIFAWAARTRDYATATAAVRALYRASGARRKLREHFDRHVDLESASESDRALLRCVHGDSERDETAA